jgi:hypothetical protein
VKVVILYFFMSRVITKSRTYCLFLDDSSQLSSEIVSDSISENHIATLSLEILSKNPQNSAIEVTVPASTGSLLYFN